MRIIVTLLVSISIMISLIACTGETRPSQSTASPVSGDKTAGKNMVPTAVDSALPASQPKASAVPGKEGTAAPSYLSNQAEAKALIEKKIKETIAAIKQKDMKRLEQLVHPAKGVQFSPYAYIDTTQDVRIEASKLATMWKDVKKKTWGQYAGSGEPIKLTFAEYYQKFVYDHDYAQAPKIGYNKIISKSNSTNNLFVVYPKDKYVTIEYHFDGFDHSLEGQDWASLRLVFEYTDNNWYLVAVTHDQGTS